jgi:hypothetical protein
VKRTLISAALLSVSVFFLWHAFSTANMPSATSLSNRTGGPISGSSNPASGTRSPAGATSHKGIGGITIAPSSPSTSTPTSQLFCSTQCQTAHSACKTHCYQSYNVTNQTHDWAQCMQGCGTNISICSNDCVAGVAPSFHMIQPFFPPSRLPDLPTTRPASTPALPLDAIE